MDNSKLIATLNSAWKLRTSRQEALHLKKITLSEKEITEVMKK